MNEIIEGYNKEKEILARALGDLNGGNDHIPRRGAIESRLREIDKMIVIIANKQK